MKCKRSTCRRILGAIEYILSAAVGRHCTDCALELGLFKETGEVA